jgi:transcription-repair coupling factor (superfamily II helicase)
MLQPNQTYTVYNILPSSDAWYIANYHKQHAASNNTGQGKFLCLVICENALDAERLAKEISFFEPQLKVVVFPDRELLPYDAFSPHVDLTSQRLATLYALNQNQCDIVITLADTCAQKIAPTHFIAQYTFNLQRNQIFNESAFKQQIQTAAYTHVTTVMHAGEFCIRGGIIDIFPMGSVMPYRIDLLGDTIESIKVFNVDSQRSLYAIDKIDLLPSREYPFDKTAQNMFLHQFKTQFNQTSSTIYQNLSKGIASAGIESYLPLFFEQQQTATLFNYLPENTHIITLGNIQKNLQNLWKEAKQHYDFLGSDNERPLLPPHSLYLKEDEWFSCIKKYGRLVLSQDSKKDEKQIYALPELWIEHKKQDPLIKLKQFCNDYVDAMIIICAESLGRLDSIQQLCTKNNLHVDVLDKNITGQDIVAMQKAGVYLQYNTVHFGFRLDIVAHSSFCKQKIIYITESHLFENYKRKENKEQSNIGDIENAIKDLAELNLGDAVVHINHGIGRYRGLIRMDTGQGQEDFFHIEYAKEANLYVPIQHLHLISRYAGQSIENAPLNHLGSAQWEKARRKAAEKIYDTASELLELYAKRSLRQGHSLSLDIQDYQKFADSFGFETTKDQQLAIDNVLQDLCNIKPMDRLVCGDVGFGKTEVAMRAAFVAVMAGKQVLILSPTTLLAEQHYQNFTHRFAPWAVNIAEFSRFKTAKEIKHNVELLNNGQLDIAIGTHKLLSADIKPTRLGLIIIDEEHRFGVRQKELVRNMRADIDVLSLTATPIPRSLGMALEGLREFSVIATAPQKRLSVKTFVREENKSIIREALMREIKRGGQVYFVHNDIASIQFRKQQIQEIMPDAHIQIAHGQMLERELEQVMKDFYHQKFHVLLCTTIIETGIDVPTANTIIMDRADHFGLAQLHQLRGRVGRSHHQAYAYLLVPDFKSLNIAAQRRLDAIQSLQELGSGFYLAMQDLEIRGAGEILGEKQSGDMQQIGFNLYTDMLNRAVKTLKQGETIDLMAAETTIDVSLGSPALLPDDYMPDVHARLSFYKKLSVCNTFDAITAIQESIIDQFGRLPQSAQLLIYSHRLRILAERIGISKIVSNHTECHIWFQAANLVNPQKIIQLLQTNRHIALNGENRLKITHMHTDALKKCDNIEHIINAF